MSLEIGYITSVVPVMSFRYSHNKDDFHQIDSIVVEYWHRVQEVWSSIPSQGPRHTKDVIKTVLVVTLFSTQP